MKSFICETIKELKRNVKFVIIFTIVFVIGVILAIAFNGKSGIDIISVNITNYYIKAVSGEFKIISIICSNLLSGIGLSLAIFLLGLSQFSAPLTCIIIFYRGVIISSALCLLFKAFGISGVVIYLILTLPAHLVITVGFIISVCLNLGVTECNFKNRTILVAKNCLISIFAVIISSIYITLILLLIIRPINSLF